MQLRLSRSPYLQKSHKKFALPQGLFAGLLILLLGVGLVSSCDQSNIRIVEPTGKVDIYVVPFGTYQRLMRGELIDIIPRKLEVNVGDKIVVENQDNITHMVGPFTVRPGETVTHIWSIATTIEGECTFIPNQKVTIVVRP